MTTYELVIEQRQPTCGGRAPTKCDVLNVTTDDPMAFVRAREPGSEPELLESGNGVTLIRVLRNGLWVKYEFTED